MEKEWKTYSMEECDRFNGATGILGEVVAICCELSYYYAKTEEEKKAVRTFREPYAVMRNKLSIDELDKINWIYNEVKPLIYGEKPKLTLDYIINNPHNGKIF